MPLLEPFSRKQRVKTPVMVFYKAKQNVVDLMVVDNPNHGTGGPLPILIHLLEAMVIRMT